MTYENNEYNNNNEYENNEDGQRGFFKNDEGELRTGRVIGAGLVGAAATAFGVHKYREHEEHEREEEQRQNQYGNQQGYPPQDQYNQQGQQQEETFFRHEDGSMRKGHTALAAVAAIGAAAFGVH
ncbi:hypothetical protein EV175_007206, partial [Coemansia sp. RSA 1933]